MNIKESLTRMTIKVVSFLILELGSFPSKFLAEHGTPCPILKRKEVEKG